MVQIEPNDLSVYSSFTSFEFIPARFALDFSARKVVKVLLTVPGALGARPPWRTIRESARMPTRSA